MHANSLKILGDVNKVLSPSPRSNFDAFDTKFTNYVQENRHLFIRNPQVMAALKARHLVLGAVHNWFRKMDSSKLQHRFSHQFFFMMKIPESLLM